MFAPPPPADGPGTAGNSQFALAPAFWTVADLLDRGNGSLKPRRLLALLSPLSALVDEAGDGPPLDLRPEVVRIYPYRGDDTQDEEIVRSRPFVDAAGGDYLLQVNVLGKREPATKGGTVVPVELAPDGGVLEFARLCYKLLGGEPVWVSRGGYHALPALTDEGNQFLRFVFKSSHGAGAAMFSAREITDRLASVLREEDDEPVPPLADPDEPTIISPPKPVPQWEQRLVTVRFLATAGLSVLMAWGSVRAIVSPPALWWMFFGLIFEAVAFVGFAVVLREAELKLSLRALARAARRGEAVAQSELGERYYHGRHCPLDYEQAFAWHLKAANQHWKESQFRVALMLEAGQGTARNPLTASGWLRQAAENGHVPARHKILHGWRLHSYGANGKASGNENVTRWRRAAMSGDAGSQFRLALSLAQGNDELHDEEEAAYWYSLAADRGHPAAQNNFGVLCATGRGVGRNEKRAAEWYARASRSGNAHGSFNLAQCYAAGRGVKRDRKMARTLLHLAASLGHTQAHETLQAMA